MSRIVKIATTCFNENFLSGTTVEDNLKKCLELIDNAAGVKPDVICLPEIFLETGLEQPVDTSKRSGEVYALLGERSVKHNCYIVAGLSELIDGRKYNVACLIDRSGNVAAKYSKIHPTIGEVTKLGFTPGDETVVFDTDFGRVGFAICYDIGWPQVWKDLKDKGAELVFWLSAYDGGFAIRSCAWQNRFPIVSAVRTDHSYFINKLGEIIGSTSEFLPWNYCEINLETAVCHNFIQIPILKKALMELGDEVKCHSYTKEHLFVLESCGRRPISEILLQYGLETYDDFHVRATHLQDAARSGRDCPKNQINKEL